MKGLLTSPSPPMVGLWQQAQPARVTGLSSMLLHWLRTDQTQERASGKTARNAPGQVGPLSIPICLALAWIELDPRGLSGIIPMTPSLVPCPVSAFHVLTTEKDLSALPVERWPETAHRDADHSDSRFQTNHITVAWPGISGPLRADKPVRSSPTSDHFMRIKEAFPFADLSFHFGLLFFI